MARKLIQKLIGFDDEIALQLKEIELKYLIDVQKARRPVSFVILAEG